MKLDFVGCNVRALPMNCYDRTCCAGFDHSRFRLTNQLSRGVDKRHHNLILGDELLHLRRLP